MTDKELLKQAYDALDKITDMFDAVNGRCVMGGDDIYDFAIQAMMQLDERLKQEQPKTNQCAETCERAKLCAVCGVSLKQDAVAWVYTNAKGRAVIVESDVKPYDDAVPLFKSELQPEQEKTNDARYI